MLPSQARPARGGSFLFAVMSVACRGFLVTACTVAANRIRTNQPGATKTNQSPVSAIALGVIAVCDKVQAFVEAGLFFERKIMTIAKEQMTINLSPEFVERLRKTAEIFGIDDAGEALEYFTGFIFKDILSGSNLREEVEAWEFRTVNEVDRIVEAASEVDAWLATAPRIVKMEEDGTFSVAFRTVALKELFD
jgi:hypothetical protein